MKPKPKTMAEATIDSVTGALGVLWDWLGDPPAKSQEKTVFDLLPSGEKPVDETTPETIDAEGKEV